MILTIVGCKKDDGGGLSVEEQQLAALTATWAATSVSDGAPRDDYGDFKITFNKNMTYTTSGGPDLLPIPSGKTTATAFEFGTDVKSDLILDSSQGGAQLHYKYQISGDGTQLTLTSATTYTGEGFANARETSVTGDWIFVFTKQ